VRTRAGCAGAPTTRTSPTRTGGRCCRSARRCRRAPGRRPRAPTPTVDPRRPSGPARSGSYSTATAYPPATGSGSSTSSSGSPSARPAPRPSTTGSPPTARGHRHRLPGPVGGHLAHPQRRLDPRPPSPPRARAPMILTSVTTGRSLGRSARGRAWRSLGHPHRQRGGLLSARPGGAGWSGDTEHGRDNSAVHRRTAGRPVSRAAVGVFPFRARLLGAVLGAGAVLRGHGLRSPDPTMAGAPIRARNGGSWSTTQVTGPPVDTAA